VSQAISQHLIGADASQAKGLPRKPPAQSATAHPSPLEPSPPKRRHDSATTSRKKSALDVSQGTNDFIAQVAPPPLCAAFMYSSGTAEL